MQSRLSNPSFKSVISAQDRDLTPSDELASTLAVALPLWANLRVLQLGVDALSQLSSVLPLSQLLGALPLLESLGQVAQVEPEHRLGVAQL